jgi:hypothetical protein
MKASKPERWRRGECPSRWPDCCVAITRGPVSFGESGQVSVFVRDPDHNVIELRGRDQDVVEGVTRYVP